MTSLIDTLSERVNPDPEEDLLSDLDLETITPVPYDFWYAD